MLYQHEEHAHESGMELPQSMRRKSRRLKSKQISLSKIEVYTFSKRLVLLFSYLFVSFFVFLFFCFFVSLQNVPCCCSSLAAIFKIISESVNCENACRVKSLKPTVSPTNSTEWAKIQFLAVNVRKEFYSILKSIFNYIRQLSIELEKTVACNFGNSTNALFFTRLFDLNFISVLDHFTMVIRYTRSWKYRSTRKSTWLRICVDKDFTFCFLSFFILFFFPRFNHRFRVYLYCSKWLT